MYSNHELHEFARLFFKRLRYRKMLSFLAFLWFFTSLAILLNGVAWAYPFPLPDIGQTKCYDDGNQIQCSEPGEAFYGQDGNYLINPPSYTKLDANGNDLPDAANSWVMVRDNVTGLIWEVKTDDGSIHDKDNTYAWQDAQDTFLAQVNASQFGGHSDWRLPTIKELSSIINLGGSKPAVDRSYFQNCIAGQYWSGSERFSGFAWSVDFYDYYGVYVEQTNKDDHIYVRCVRSQAPGLTEPLIINGNDTVTDRSTGLMWQQNTSSDVYSWERALSHAESLTLAGYDDWRLPNSRELLSIVNYDGYTPSIDWESFPATKTSMYWTSNTPPGLSGAAMYVGFRNGNLQSENKPYDYYVRCVRGGQCRLLDEAATRQKIKPN